MIKINLLPPHVVEKRKVRSLAILLLALLLVELGGFFFYYATLVRTEEARKATYTEVNAAAVAVENLQAEAAAEIAAAGPLQSKVNWYDKIYKHNSKIAEALEKINEYIYARLTIQKLTLTGNQVRLEGATKDLDHIASAYLNLLRSPYISPPKGVTFVPVLAERTPTSGPTPQRMMNVADGRRAMGTPEQMARTANLADTSRTIRASDNSNEAVRVSFNFGLKSEYAIGTGQSMIGGPGGGSPGAGRPGVGPTGVDPAEIWRTGPPPGARG